MNKKEAIKRYFILFVGLMFNAFGVAFLTKSGLGASPISAIPFALSLVFPALSMGNWLIFFSLILIVIQIIILGKEIGKRNLILQLILTFIYGYFTDFAVWALSFLSPSNYFFKIICLLIGCAFFGFGVNFELVSNISMLPGNALPKAAAVKLGREYGIIRTFSDVSMSVVSAVISLIFLKKLVSVREGTVIAAIFIGNTVTVVKKILCGFWSKLQAWSVNHND